MANNNCVNGINNTTNNDNTKHNLNRDLFIAHSLFKGTSGFTLDRCISRENLSETITSAVDTILATADAFGDDGDDCFIDYLMDEFGTMVDQLAMLKGCIAIDTDSNEGVTHWRYLNNPDALVSRCVADGTNEYGEYAALRDATRDCVNRIMEEYENLSSEWGTEFAQLDREYEAVWQLIREAEAERYKHDDEVQDNADTDLADLATLAAKVADNTDTDTQLADLVALSAKLADVTSKFGNQ